MSDTGILGKGNPSAPIRNRTLDLPITSSDALPLSYRRLEVGFKKHFSMFGNRMKHSSSCLLYFVKLNRANLFIKRRFFFFLKVNDNQGVPIFFKASRKPFEGRSGFGKVLTALHRDVTMDPLKVSEFCRTMLGDIYCPFDACNLSNYPRSFS